LSHAEYFRERKLAYLMIRAISKIKIRAQFSRFHEKLEGFHIGIGPLLL